MPIALMLEGELDVDKLRNAFYELINTYEVFRTSFHMVEGEIVQKIHKEVARGIDYISSYDAELDGLVNAFIKPFDLGAAPLIRGQIVKLGEKRFALLIDMHHIISDGVSMLVFIKELASLYEGQQTPVLKVQYKDYVCWLNEFIVSEEFKKQENFWLNKYSGEIPVLNMPLDYSVITSYSIHYTKLYESRVEVMDISESVQFLVLRNSRAFDDHWNFGAVLIQTLLTQ